MPNLENDNVSYSQVSFEAEEQSEPSSSTIDYKAIFDHSETFDSNESSVYTENLSLHASASVNEVAGISDASFDENESSSESNSDDFRNKAITFRLATEETSVKPVAPVKPSALFTVSQMEWRYAEEFFASSPHAIKFDKKISKLNHSFVNINGEIYAIHNRHIDKFPIPRGTNAKIKRVINKQGEDFGLRIEGAENTKIGEDSRILNKLDILRGEEFRSYNKTFRSMKYIHPTYKHYSVFKYNDGVSLDHFLKNNVLSQMQKIQIANACCEALRALQKERIVHGDIKPANLVINEKDGNYTIAMIDFGFSKELPPGRDYIRAKGLGSKPYMAPEMKEYDYRSRYSFASDIYAMGVMFNRDIKLGRNFDFMTHFDPNHRHNVDYCQQVLANMRTPAVPQLIVTPVPVKSPAVSQRREEFYVTFAQRMEYQPNPDIKVQPEESGINSQWRALLEIDVLQRYRELKHQASKPTQWMKTLGKKVSDKREMRMAWLNDFERLKYNIQGENLSTFEKAKIMYAVVHDMERTIRREHNLYESALASLCVEFKDSIKAMYASDRVYKFSFENLESEERLLRHCLESAALIIHKSDTRPNFVLR
ncbi:protein kinase domain-containing protein [Candidatus Berkiella aquae]|uniref:Protein kinase n=1 Tax=Candidatus Berkiella aquae TaxID=295108 RepID=A0A0Q9YJD6_9GAMM|nr:protein kinase family protein [Candidatus Berkiella aquae]MCS5710649.1 protein kinase [Candidatus Berkiella aquae]